jgi:hypothetical protein
VISAKVFAKTIEKFVSDNAPGILTGVGVVGAISTSVLSVKATIKAKDILAEETDRRFRDIPDIGIDEAKRFTKSETVKLVWTEYIPPAGTLAVTVAAIVCANRISAGRMAALATAYSLNEKRFSEYRDKVVEKFNPNKERQLRDEIAQDRVTENPPKESQIIITGNGDVMCLDIPTERYFKSNMEKLRQVMNDINAQVNEFGSAPLSDFYVALGLKETPYSEDLGWTRDSLLNVQFSAVLTSDNQPCIAIDYQMDPIRGRFRRSEGCMEDPGF